MDRAPGAAAVVTLLDHIAGGQRSRIQLREALSWPPVAGTLKLAGDVDSSPKVVHRLPCQLQTPDPGGERITRDQTLTQHLRTDVEVYSDGLGLFNPKSKSQAGLDA